MDFYTKSSCNTEEVTEQKQSHLELHIKSGKKIKVCISQALNILQVQFKKRNFDGFYWIGEG